MISLLFAVASIGPVQAPVAPATATQAPATTTAATASSSVPVAGTIAIDTVNGKALTDPARAIFVDAVQRALAGRGFTLLGDAGLGDAGHGRYLAEVTVDRAARGVVSAGRSGGGAPQMSLNGGVSLGLPAGGDRLSDLVVTQLTIAIRERDSTRIVWSGSAVTARVSNTPAGNVALVAQTLATAVMAQFPARTAGAVSIP